MSYIMRTDAGIGMWEVDNTTAQRIINKTPGEWFRSKSGKLCYRVLVDGSWVMETHAYKINLLMFSGYYLSPYEKE